MTNPIKNNKQYKALVEHWQNTNDKLTKTRIEEEILSSAKVLLITICKKHSYGGRHSEEDLMQEACLGVLKSLEKWDAEKAKEAKFVSYMMLWVNAYIYNYMSHNSGDIRIPKRNLEKVLKDIKEEGQISEENKEYTTSYIYLDKARENPEEIGSILYSDYSMYSINDVVERNNVRDAKILASKALKSIKDERLHTILRKRAEGETLREIGKSMGITRERVRQLEERGIQLLRSNKRLMKDIKDWRY